MTQDLSGSHEATLDEPTVTLPTIQRQGGAEARAESVRTDPPENHGPANHPPGNHGPRPHRPSPYRDRGRNSKIPSPARPAGDEDAADRDDNAAPFAGDGRDNAPPLAGEGGRVASERARNQAMDRLWSARPNRSAAARSATRPFVRVRGKHAAMSRRQRWERRYVRMLVAGDLTAGVAAGAVTFGLRFGDEVTTYNRWYLLLSALLPVALLAVLVVSRAYERRFLFVGTDEYQRVLRGGIGLIASAAVVSYALELDLARSYVLAALPTAIGTAVVLRFAMRKRLHIERARGESLRRVLVVGHELSVIGITRQLRRERYHGLEVVGACLPPDHDGVIDLPVYGTFDDVANAVDTADADTVVVLSCPELDGVALRRLAWRLERDEVDLIVASALIDVAGARTTIRPFDGLPMLHVEHPRLHGGARVVKDLFDRLGALILLVVFGPVLLTVALCVRLTSRGPVLFRQVRVGRDGSEFRIFKFRSMYVDAEARLAELRHLNEHDGVLFKIRDDPRVTPVGRWLRRLSLDELPQLLNVLLGQMSLVGPRPPLPSEVAAYADDVRRRLAVKPGMTGLWQVSGRSDLPWEEAVRLDLRYVENWSLSLDLMILLRTMTAVLRSSGAY
ncbi:sugar transferase [Actinoplanes sp. NPDC049316]|uniref:sugar transferase n=1 Tax=Actinoplanes sp. NPDC049316 TaxID=3154727 RepID=UPI00343804A8